MSTELVALVGIFRLVENRKELVVLLLSDGVVLVSMALGAVDGGSHPHRKRGVDPVDHRQISEFLVDGSPFVVGLRVPMKGGGHQFLLLGFRKEIPCDLLQSELIEGFVFVEGTNERIPVAPNGPWWIIRIPRRIRIAGQIQPYSRPAAHQRRAWRKFGPGEIGSFAQ